MFALELDKFMQDMLASQATQLRELQHVIGFIDKFISNYKRESYFLIICCSSENFHFCMQFYLLWNCSSIFMTTSLP